MKNAPFAKTELLQAVAAVNDEVAGYFAAIPVDKFFMPLAEAWSPAENVVHLIKSVSPVAKAMKLPKLFLRAWFGVAKEPSQNFGQIKEAYQRILANDGKARGRFIPVINDVQADFAPAQQKILRKWDEVGNRLYEALQEWPENDLDKYRLPHPLLGKLTMREMLFFTLYHNLHHVNNVRRRLGEIMIAV